MRRFFIFLLSLIIPLCGADHNHIHANKIYVHYQTNYIWQLNHIFMSNIYDGNWKFLHKNMIDPCYLNYYYDDQIKNFSNVNPGDIIWIPTAFLSIFFEKILPLISVPFILVTGWGDYSPYGVLQNKIYELLQNKKLIHWFAQEYDIPFKYSKFSPLPLGVDYHAQFLFEKGCFGEIWQHPQKQEEILNLILQKANITKNRITGIYADWHLNDNLYLGSHKLYLKCGYTRTSLKKQFEDKNFVYFQKDYLPRTQVWENKSKFAFSISPHGSGWDCHRTWEDLILGMIVIVKTSTLDPLYEGLPVVIVQDWSEVTEENLAKWLQQYGDALTNPSYREKLTSAYWINKIKTKQREWREQNGYLPDGRPLAHQAKDAMQAQLAAMHKSVRKSVKRRQS